LATTTLSLAAEVCREASFAGLDEKTESVKRLIGHTTTSLDDIKLYIGWEEGKPYIQSNFRSADPDHPGTFSEYPTKILSSNVSDLGNALSNVIFWGKPPEDSDLAVSRALQGVTIYLDEKMIRPNGEIGFDIGIVDKVRIVAGDKVASYGDIKLLRLKKPPPIATEVIAGCCLRGRPPGKGQIILGKLQKREFDAKGFRFLPLIGTSGTHTVIEQQLPVLHAAAQRTSTSGRNWEARLEQALEASRGKNLIVMSHMVGNKLAVRSPDGIAFEISISTLREKARAAGVDLILLGCDTAEYIKDATQDLGVVGKVDSVAVARRLEKAVEHSANIAELTERLASADVELVAYDEQGGHGYAGASAFSRIPHTNFFARVFRLLALRKGE
jgi:hypothetical protein